MSLVINILAPSIPVVLLILKRYLSGFMNFTENKSFFVSLLFVNSKFAFSIKKLSSFKFFSYSIYDSFHRFLIIIG